MSTDERILNVHFKLQVVSWIINDGQPLELVCEQHGLYPPAVRRWLEQYGGLPAPAPESCDQLRQQLQALEAENLRLRRINSRLQALVRRVRQQLRPPAQTC